MHYWQPSVGGGGPLGHAQAFVAIWCQCLEKDREIRSPLHLCSRMPGERPVVIVIPLAEKSWETKKAKAFQDG